MVTRTTTRVITDQIPGLCASRIDFFQTKYSHTETKSRRALLVHRSLFSGSTCTRTEVQLLSKVLSKYESTKVTLLLVLYEYLRTEDRRRESTAAHPSAMAPSPLLNKKQDTFTHIVDERTVCLPRSETPHPPCSLRLTWPTLPPHSLAEKPPATVVGLGQREPDGSKS